MSNDQLAATTLNRFKAAKVVKNVFWLPGTKPRKTVYFEIMEAK